MDLPSTRLAGDRAESISPVCPISQRPLSPASILFARIDYEDDTFPGIVSLKAFNPFIPTNEDDSSIPAAFFEFVITNNTHEDMTYTVVGVLANPLPPNNINAVEETPWGHALRLSCDSVDADSIEYGEMTLATDAGLADDVDISWQRYWFKGAWFDNLEVYWHDLTTPGPFKDRTL